MPSRCPLDLFHYPFGDHYALTVCPRKLWVRTLDLFKHEGLDRNVMIYCNLCRLWQSENETILNGLLLLNPDVPGSMVIPVDGNVDSYQCINTFRCERMWRVNDI